MTGILLRKGTFGPGDSHGRWPWEDIGRDGSDAATSQGTRGATPGAGSGKDGSSPGGFGGSVALPTLASRTVRLYVSVVFNHPVGGFVMAALRN